jgi:hypothetical protein
MSLAKGRMVGCYLAYAFGRLSFPRKTICSDTLRPPFFRACAITNSVKPKVLMISLGSSLGSLG